MYESEHELIAACIEGIPDAWTQFKEQYQRLIRAVIVRTTRVDESTVDDLEALVYQKMLEDRCRRLTAWRGRARFSTYLVQVTRNLVLDWVDKEGRRISTEPLRPGADATVAADDFESKESVALQAAALRDAIRALPEKQALLMRLRLEGQSIREIAKLTRRPVGTVSVENSRAMAKLRHLLENNQLFVASMES